MCLIFVGQGYPRKLFNLEHFPIYGIFLCVGVRAVEILTQVLWLVMCFQNKC